MITKKMATYLIGKSKEEGLEYCKNNKIYNKIDKSTFINLLCGKDFDYGCLNLRIINIIIIIIINVYLG